MKEEISTYLNQPGQLEKLYRANKADFKRAFNTLYPELKGNASADFWNERLNYEAEGLTWGTRKELLFVIIASLAAGLIAKLPAILSISEDFFYPRNIGFIVFPGLSVYFAWKNKLSLGKTAFIIGTSLFGLVFINSLPEAENSDTLILSCIHLLVFLWLVFCFAFVGDRKINVEKRLNFLKYNGDLIVMASLILLAGAILTGITIGLFSLIGYDIQQFYTEYVVVFGLAAVPMAGTHLTRTNPQLVGKISPVIAKIFSPLVLVMLVIYLSAIIYSGKDPYNDREFLLMFNALLIGVMALIFFSVAETSATKSRMEAWVLFLLSIVTIIVNGIALSAILFRISEWGITPNRTAVLGGNALILIHLLSVTGRLFRVLSRKSGINSLSKAIASYLPVYFIWAIIVTFIFPFIFGFK